MVGPSGEQVGVVRVEDALRLAEEAGLDLVEVAPDARPPVCKLMDYGKFKYESAMKARDARRNQANTQLKEIQFRPKIDEHDYATKMGHVRRFLEGGDKVKCIVRFRGREQSRPELGVRLLAKVAEEVGELATIESHPRQDGRQMVMVLAPTRKKAEVKSDQRRRREEARASRRAEKHAAKAAQAAAQAASATQVAETPAAKPPAAKAAAAKAAAAKAPAKPAASAKPTEA
uniref:translation initiation factor IF-3 n=1 Tax=Actinomyces timonensis TaxID=1288391 RepID=UPI003F550273